MADVSLSIWVYGKLKLVTFLKYIYISHKGNRAVFNDIIFSSPLPVKQE